MSSGIGMRQQPFSILFRQMQLKGMLLCLATFLTITGAQAAPEASPAGPRVQIGAASFGLFDASTPGELSFEAGKVVPLRVGQRYGWVIEVQTRKRRVSVREEYLLPPKAGENDRTDIIMMETRRQVSQRELAVIDGKIYGEWSVGQGEPAGHRRLQVFVDNELAGDFEYDVK